MLVLEYKVQNPKKEQVNAIEEAIRTTQFVRNKCLRHWMDAGIGVKINGYELNKYCATLREELSFVKELNSMACQAAAERAWFAITRFYENCKTGKSGKKGYPTFQKDNRSVEYKTSGWKLHETKRRIAFTDKKGIGELKLIGTWDIHRYELKSIKRVRIVRRADGYYVQFCIAVEVEIQPRNGNGEIGLDVGLEYFYSDSNGHHEENPRFLRKAEKSIKKLQRRISKKKKGSSNRRKARQRLQGKHLKISRQRNEHALRLARNLCKLNSFVAYENLSIKNMVKNHCLAKSINDASWYAFRCWIEYFARKFNTTVVAVEPKYSSQECSNCGRIAKKSLSTRTHTCQCGCILQRDTNAAVVLLNRGRSTVGRTESKARGVVTSTLLGESLVEQVVTEKRESPRL